MTQSSRLFDFEHRKIDQSQNEPEEVSRIQINLASINAVALATGMWTSSLANCEQ